MSKSNKRILLFKWLTPVITIVLMALILELALYAVGGKTIYERAVLYSTEPASWWSCDSLNGPQFVPAATTGEENYGAYFMENNIDWYYDRLRLVNAQGYHDTEDFTAETVDTAAFRVLFLGDSFTWGASSDVGYSYVEVFESKLAGSLPAAQVWNTGMPATGTNHALFAAHKFLPVQQSDLVILGFFVSNDLNDNMLPFDRLVFTDNGSCYKRYKLNKAFEPEPQSMREAFKSATGTYPLEELNFVQRRLVKSHLYAFLKTNGRKVYNKLFSPNWKTDYDRLKFDRSRSYLKQLKTLVEKQGGQLMIVLIPDYTDLVAPSADYKKCVRMFEELSIPYLETLNFLQEEDYVNKINDDHWNNAGHEKIGEILAAHILNTAFN